MRIKPEIRLMGIDDAYFCKGDREALVIGVVFRGGFWIDGMVSTTVAVDGLDATDRIMDMIVQSKYKDLRAIMLSGVTIAGFNVVDIQKLSEKTGLPVIVVVEKFPDFDKIELAISNVKYPEMRLEMIRHAGELYKLHGSVYFQCYGMCWESAKKIIEMTSTHSNIPEPLRVSHIIASALTRGEASKR
ncbi:MAG: endonuclease dU [Candidatus Methanofastidiosia archaeon]